MSLSVTATGGAMHPLYYIWDNVWDNGLLGVSR
jgi:hypothetical protein